MIVVLLISLLVNVAVIVVLLAIISKDKVKA